MSDAKKITQLLETVEQMDLQELMELASYEKNKDKQKVLEALYTYALDKKQTELIRREEFIL